MDSDLDRFDNDRIDMDERLIVDELCNYQSRIDHGDALDDNPQMVADLPLELQSAIYNSRTFLDFLNDSEFQSESLFESTATSKSMAGYAPPTRIGRFKILTQLGYGGFGVVFRGIDPVIGREVAIKVPRPEFLESPEFIERFAREASIVAQLSHPNIVAIFESGCYEVIPYIVMPYLSGKSLPEWLAGEPDVQPGIVCKIVHELALAVAHAHERGILHRDLKPGNVILAKRQSVGASDEFPFIPMLTDFGMARCAEIGFSHTHTGAVIGTSGYMSPEQAEGRSRDITARTDVYGLGTVLYELLTGRPPFQASNDIHTLRNVLRDDPISPSVIRPQIPIDLSVICLKCLEKSPANRYSSAGALAEDLQRFLDGDAILARPISPLARAQKWIRRYPTRATVIATGVVGVVALIGVSLFYNSRLITLLDEAKAQRLSAQRNERHIRQRAYDSDMRNAKFSLDRGNIRLMLKFLERQTPNVGEEDIRGFSWWCLWRNYEESSRSLGFHDGGATAVAVTNKGDLAASAGSDGIIRIWSMPSGTLLAELRAQESNSVEAISYSPDGQRLASIGNDGTLRVWDLAKMQQLFSRRDSDSPLYDVAYSPRGDLIATAGGDKMIRLWNANTGSPAGVLSGHTDNVFCLAFHPTEDTLASGGADATIRLWDLCDRSPDARIHGGAIHFSKPNQWPRALVFDRSGKSLFAGIASADTYHFSMEPQNYGHVLSRQSERANAISLALAGNNSLIVGLGNSEIRVADSFDLGLSTEWLRGHFRAVLSVATPDDGSFLLSASDDGQVRYWPQFQRRSRIVVVPDYDSMNEADPSANSIQWRDRFLAVDFQQKEVSIFRMPERNLERSFPMPKDAAFALSPSGRMLLIVGRDGLTTLHRVETGGVVWSNNLPSSQFHRLPDSCVIDSADEYSLIACERELLVVSMRTSEILHRLDHPDNVLQVLCFQNGMHQKIAVSTCMDGNLRFWDIEKEEILKQFQTNDSAISSLAISNDQRLIAVTLGGENPVVKIIRIDDMTVTAVVPIPNQFGSRGFENNKAGFLTSNKLVVQSKSGISLWDVRDEAELIAFPEFEFTGLFAISPDGQQLAIPQRGCVRLIDGRPETTSNTSRN